MTRAVTERDLRHPDFARGEPDEYEFREDGKIVRKDRWENGIRRIAGALGMSRQPFEVSDVAGAVEKLIASQVDFDDWLGDNPVFEGYASHIADSNFSHRDVVALMEQAYNAGKGRV